METTIESCAANQRHFEEIVEITEALPRPRRGCPSSKCSVQGLGCIFAFLIATNSMVNFDAGGTAAVLVLLSKGCENATLRTYGDPPHIQPFDPEYPCLDQVFKGYLGAAPYLGLCCGCPLIGYLLDRYPAKLVLVFFLSLTSAATFVFAYEIHKEWMILAKFVIGLTHGSISIYAPIWVASFAPAGNKTLWYGLMQSAAAIGNVIGYTTCGYMITAGVFYQWGFRFQATYLVLSLFGLMLLSRSRIDVRSASTPAVAFPLEVPTAAENHQSNNNSNDNYNNSSSDANPGSNNNDNNNSLVAAVATGSEPGSEPGELENPGQDLASSRPRVQSDNLQHQQQHHPFHMQLHPSGSVGSFSSEGARLVLVSMAPQVALTGEDRGGGTSGHNGERSRLSSSTTSFASISIPLPALGTSRLAEPLVIPGDDDDARVRSHFPEMSERCFSNSACRPLRLLGYPIFVATLASLTALYFVVTSIQYWASEYFVKEFQRPGPEVTSVFAFVSASAPLMGVVLGSSLVDKMGGIGGLKQVLKICRLDSLFAFVATLAGLVAGFVPPDVGGSYDNFNFYMVVIGIWVQLFFGGAMLPSVSGISLESVPKAERAIASSVSMLVCNLLGFVLGVFLPGVLSERFGMRRAMQVAFCWAGLGCLGMVAACTVARTELRGGGRHGESTMESDASAVVQDGAAWRVQSDDCNCLSSGDDQPRQGQQQRRQCELQEPRLG